MHIQAVLADKIWHCPWAFVVVVMITQRVLLCGSVSNLDPATFTGKLTIIFGW